MDALLLPRHHSAVLAPPRAIVGRVIGRWAFSCFYRCKCTGINTSVLSVITVQLTVLPSYPDLPQPSLPGIADKPSTESPFARTSDLAAKLPQRPLTPPAKDPTPTTSRTPIATFGKPLMESYQDDPWSAPDLHKGHKHGPEVPNSNGSEASNGTPGLNGTSNGVHDEPPLPTPGRTTSTFTTTGVSSARNDDSLPSTRQNSFGPSQSAGGAWGAEYFGAEPQPITGQASSPFGGSNGGRDPAGPRPLPANRTIGTGRTSGVAEEKIFVTLLPEKEGMFMFQHHNYEVGSSRRGSKVIRRYSDFVWLLDCLHKRYPFRVLPLLPPKRVAGTRYAFADAARFEANLVCSQR